MTLYFHSKDLRKRRVTVAGVVNGGILSLGVARCSKKDTFVKAKGRLISRGRAESNPSYSCEYTGRCQFTVLAKKLSEFMTRKNDLKLSMKEIAVLDELAKADYSEQQINHELANQ